MIETQEYKNFHGFTGDSHKVGVSKPLSELSVNDIIDFDKYVCGAINNFVNVQNIGVNPQISLPVDSDNKIMYSTALSWDNTYFCSKKTQNKIYMRSLLLAIPSNKAYRDYIFTHADNDVRIVTELTDYQDLFITINESTTSSRYTTAGIVSTGKNTEIYTDTLDTGENILPVWIISDGVNVWINSGIIYNGYYCKAGNNLTNQGFSNAMKTFTESNDLYLMWGYNPNDTNDVVKCKNIIPDNTVVQLENNGCTFGIKITYSTKTPLSAIELLRSDIKYNETQYFDNNPLIHISAYYGMYIRSTSKHNGSYIWYKPIITDGMVTGYTTDMKAKSDIDEWEILDNHNIPIIPPSSGDDIDEIGINDFPINDIGGLARYYAIDKFQLDELQGDFKNSTSGIPLDAGQFVIGLYQLPLDIPSFCTTNQEKIVLGKLETNAVGKKILTVNRRVHLGEYFISANCGNNFLDYSPYTEIKLYIPYCGMVELPPNLFINSTVNVDMIIDIISGSCKGIVMCNNTFYTSVNGSLMCSLPLSLEQCATKSLSVINSANSIMSGIIFGNKEYSALNTVTTLGEAMIENNNIAPSHISGNMDSVVNFYDPQCCILFMTYPEVNMGDIGKTHGKVCNYQDTLNNCHGYTVVNNPHLEIKCTNTEKDEITKLLEQGVILP